MAGHLQPFGRVAHVLDKTDKRKKFDPKTSRCIFIGYSPTSKAYRMWNPKSCKVLKSCDVFFLDEFPAGENAGEIIDDDVLLLICAKKENYSGANLNIEDGSKECEMDRRSQTRVLNVDGISNREDSIDEFYSIESFEEEEQPSSSDSDISGFAPAPGHPRL